ncbi:hypothetical protein MA16_Dca001120 [Dendrobium catenatum]|uniref:Uncharacterized protein n=1 Tax=Dendrobium catenatum TaxID=906689 RepID=A0A2I0WLI2_9ASPA|nr:hypothetical protein MA16_Dca001120 [Dendrobium catenatum]
MLVSSFSSSIVTNLNVIILYFSFFLVIEVILSSISNKHLTYEPEETSVKV